MTKSDSGTESVDGSSGGDSYSFSHISHIPKGMKKEKKTNTPAFKQLRGGNDEVSDTAEGSRGFIHTARKQTNSWQRFSQ